jgi:hypothetical protein
LTPEQVEEEQIRRLGLWFLMIAQAGALVAVALNAPFWIAVSYGGVGGGLIAHTLRHLKGPPA